MTDMPRGNGSGLVPELAEDEDVVAFLMHSHQVTRSLLAGARRLIAAAGSRAEIVSVAEAMVRFFTFWNPLHEIDEEQTVAPAVSAFAPSEDARAIVGRVVREHEGLDAVRARFAAPWNDLHRAPERFYELRAELAEITARLQVAHTRHTAREEKAFFPLVRLYVPADAQRAMLAVMRARRRGAVETTS